MILKTDRNEKQDLALPASRCRFCISPFCGCTKNEEPAEIVTDEDGNVYACVTIGTQVWMAENLKTSKYNDGSAIPLVSVNSKWGTYLQGIIAGMIMMPQTKPLVVSML